MSSTSLPEGIYVNEKMRASNKNISHLTMTIIFTEADFDNLINNLCNPPSLIDLARQVGLNERKLKQGFRHVFGNSVFGYLHDYQMQQAQRLLLAEKMTVAGVAARVGYTSPTGFCAAFRRKFGINPKAYQIAGRISLG